MMDWFTSWRKMAEKRGINRYRDLRDIDDESFPIIGIGLDMMLSTRFPEIGKSSRTADDRVGPGNLSQALWGLSGLD